MDSTDLVNFNLIKEINGNNYFLKISNLFDEHFQRPHGYNHDGRFIKIGTKF